jgi:IclR family KDG regulon transcriptional repressor
MEANVVKSVGRVLGVLELFEKHRRPLNATQICDQLNLPKSSANALLKSLVQLGYLSLESPSKNYFPTLSLTNLGEWLPPVLFGSGDVMNALQELNNQTQETVTLSVPNGLSMQFIHVLAGTFPISLNVREGALVPMFGTGVGIAQLSTRSDEEIAKLAQQANRGAKKRVDLDETMEYVKEARANGFAEAYDRVLPESGAIAMAVPAGTFNRSLVIAVGGPWERIKNREPQLVRDMRRALRGLK